MSRPRGSGRATDALRPLTIETGAVPYAEGSCLISTGNTRVLCAASVAIGVPAWRERSGNVIDVPARRAAVAAAVREALAKPREKFKNVYGDGAAGRRIVDLLATLSLDKGLLMKRNAY